MVFNGTINNISVIS